MATPSGRSPYPTRSRSRRLAQQTPAAQNDDGGDDHHLEGNRSSQDEIFEERTERERQSRMRMPRTSLGSVASIGSSSTATGGGFRLGQGLVQAKLSPTAYNSSTAGSSTGNRKNNKTSTNVLPGQKRFFPSVVTQKEHVDDAQRLLSEAGPEHQTSGGKESSMVDGMPIDQLRQLAKNPNHPSQIAVFYAGIVYAKTQSKEDAYLYASMMVQNKEYKRAVRLLETTSGLLQNQHQDVAATLLAVQALAHLEDWQAILALLEDDHALYASIAASSNLNTNTSNLVFEDDDDTAWMALGEQYLQNQEQTKGYDKDTSIHPLSLLMHFRATAYAKTGHPLRASIFWKRSLQFDVRCVPALEGLLESSSMMDPSHPSPMKVILEQVQFPKHYQFLKDYYMAKLVVDDTDSQLHTKREKKEISAPFWQDNHDTSSIQLISPKKIMMMEDTNITTTSPHDANLDLSMATTATNAKDNPRQHSWQVALDELWKTHKLQKSSEVLAMAAERAYQQHHFHRALELCEQLHTLDPLCPTAGFTYVATLVALQKKRTLFQLAHEWVDAAPKSSKAWFAVGAYYYACQRYHVAQRHFCRATRLDPHSPQAWIAFGTSFAMCDESDQALASFRAAQRLSPGDSISLLYIGMEYLRTNHIVLAHHFLQAAHQANPADPLVCNEMGVLYMSSSTRTDQESRYAAAIEWLTKALVLATGYYVPSANASDEATILDLLQSTTLQTATNGTYWEPTLFNLATAYRKLRKFHIAIECLTTCLSWKESPGAYSALGYCHHLLHCCSKEDEGHIHMAIEHYHQSLSRKPDDPFCTKMLEQALADALAHTSLIPDDNTSSTIKPDGSKSAMALTPASSQDQSSMMLTASEEQDAGFSFSVDGDDDSDVDMG
eukprot:scaffold5887_cov122-Cylindrotheca_fusiformis.AAC.7